MHSRVKPKEMYLRRMMRHADHGDTELFFVPVPMGDWDGMPREANAQPANVVSADVDHEFTDAQWALIERLDATVNESGGVGRHHVFVPLDVPHPPDVIKELNRALRDALDGDAKQSPASFLRVPGSYNRKGKPVLCRTVRLSSSRQSASELRQALGTDVSSTSAPLRTQNKRETPTEPVATSRRERGMRINRTLRDFNSMYHAGKRTKKHALVMGLVKDCIRAGLTLEQTWGVVEELDAAQDKAAEENTTVVSQVIKAWNSTDAREVRSELATADSAVSTAPAGIADEPEKRAKPKRSTSRFLSRQQLRERPEPQWLVERLIPEYGIGQLFGPTYGGKTYAAIDLVMRITSGMNHWIGHTIKLNGPVFYVLMEGGFDFAKRLDAWEMKYGRTSDELYVMVEEELNLNNPESLEQLAEDITAISSTPRLLVVDTQSLAIQGVEENDNTGMNEVMQKLKRLSKALGCFVLLVHHTGYATEERGRGASAQPAALDTIIRIKGSDKSGREIAVPKVKAGREVKDRNFRLEEQKNGWPAFVEITGMEALEHYVSNEDKIIRYLRWNGPLTPPQIAEGVDGIADSTARNLCKDMADPEKCAPGEKPRLVIVGTRRTSKLYNIAEHLREENDAPDPAGL
ncbi:AAA family ATPase [Streptomyces virginiae]|uniref:AAA family ATPase n=1 Tax=Streptomyces virginiae TaxID=1961 RepID=UPI0036A00E07